MPVMCLLLRRKGVIRVGEENKTKILKSTGSTTYSLSTIDQITSLSIPINREKELTKILTDFLGVCVELGLEITEKEKLTEKEEKFCSGLDELSGMRIYMQEKTYIHK